MHVQEGFFVQLSNEITSEDLMHFSVAGYSFFPFLPHLKQK